MKAQIRAACLASGLVLATAASAQVAFRAPSVSHPAFNGTFTDAAGGQGTFSGSLLLQRFDARGDRLVIVGTLTGALADAAGSPLARVNEEAALPVTLTGATCAQLGFEIGPVARAIADIQVQLQKNVMGIAPRDGPSEALLCSVSSLLTTHPTLPATAAALNQVLGAVRK